MRRIVAPALWGAALLLCGSTLAGAHFQLVYTPQVNIGKPTDLPLKLVFWHPMSNGYVMDMSPPEAFFVLHRGVVTDLRDSLSPITFRGAENDAKAYQASATVKRNGDYVFVLIPSPYYEQSEDLFIQQITKSYVNKGGIPSGWQQPVGLPAEIVPFNKPYAIVAGSTFSGLVVADGKPVPGAEIEVEYMAAEPDMTANRPRAPTVGPIPGGAIAAIADSNGIFTFGIPRAGFWGFAATGVGPMHEHEGKGLNQDAVLWIRAHDLE